jgi:hypothetical protein
LIVFDINISLLINVIESSEFQVEVTELVEIVRAMDILGAERRLKEYEAMLYLSFKDPDERNCIYEDPRLPANFSDHVKGFESQAESVILGIVGSQRLIEFSFNHGLEMERDDLFQQLCRFEHLSLAQWLYNQGEVDIISMLLAIVHFDGHVKEDIYQWLDGYTV